MTSPIAFLLCAALSALFMLTQSIAERSTRLRSAVRFQYSNEGYVLFKRNGIAVVPLLGPAVLLVGIALLLPRPMGAWLCVPAFVLFDLALVAAYRVPSPFLPKWLRAEIDQGSMPLARPDFIDWVYFAIVFSVVTLAIAGLPILIVVYHDAG
jgi:hypothetical protein